MIVLGAPGIGKTTLCKKIAQERNVILVRLSEIQQRANDASNAEEFAQCLVDRLLEDDCIEQGWLLDGFTGSAIEINTLVKAGLKPHACLMMQAQEEIVMKRFCGQRVDPETGTLYHEDSNMPEEEDILARLQPVSPDCTEDGFKTKFGAIQSAIDEVISILSPQDTVVAEEEKEEKKEGDETAVEEEKTPAPVQICPIEEIIAAGSADDVFIAACGVIDGIDMSVEAQNDQEEGEEKVEREDIDQSRLTIASLRYRRGITNKPRRNETCCVCSHPVLLRRFIRAEGTRLPTKSIYVISGS